MDLEASSLDVDAFGLYLGRDAEYVGNSSSALVVVGGEYSGKYGRLVDEEMVVCVVLDEGVEFSGNLHGIWRT